MRYTVRGAMPKSKPKRQLNIRIDPDRVERLREIAAAEHRSLSAEFRRMVDERIAEAEEKAKAA